MSDMSPVFLLIFVIILKLDGTLLPLFSNVYCTIFWYTSINVCPQCVEFGFVDSLNSNKVRINHLCEMSKIIF